MLHRWGEPGAEDVLRSRLDWYPWKLTRPEPLEDAHIGADVMSTHRGLVDGTDLDVDRDALEEIFALLETEGTPARPGLTEFLWLLSGADDDIGRLAAHRLAVQGAPGARERLLELLRDSCFVYYWNAGRYGPLPETVLEALSGME